MKTAQDWWEEWWGDNPIDISFIKEIQLDAFKAGMTKAAEICGSHAALLSVPIQSSALKSCASAIAMTRDNLKPEDMK